MGGGLSKGIGWEMLQLAGAQENDVGELYKRLKPSFTNDGVLNGC